MFSVILFISIPNGFHLRHARRDIFNARQQRSITPMPVEMSAAPENGCIGLTILEGAAIVAAASAAISAGANVANAIDKRAVMGDMNHGLKKRC